VAMEDQGNRYVADTFRRQVVVFSPNNEAIRELGHPGDDKFKPVSLAFFQGKLYVLNGARHQIEVWAPDTGQVLQVIGEQGEGPGQMLFPNGIALDDAGQIYVTDTLNCRVQVFAPDGNLVRMFGEPGDRAGEFSRPKHLVIGPEGVIYVADAGFQRVQMFDSEGRVLMLFGGSGTEPGSMVLPAGICIDKTLLPYFADRIPAGFDAEYLIFVSDQFSPHKVGIYAFGNSATSKAPSPASPATQPSTLSKRPE